MVNKTNLIGTVLLTAIVITGCSKDPNKLVESGKKYIADAKYPDAVLQLRSAIQLNPQLGEAHNQLAIAYLHMGLLRDADQEVTRTINLQAENIDAKLLHGNLSMIVDHNLQ